ncbi:MAG: TIGR01777 family protein [Deltaproteobacteria bacterium]|nr:MAG: TIGR01777 family protein [Deltaproteobacteria bacterium]
MKAVIIGSSGFVGRHMQQKLLDLGWDLMGVDLFPPAPGAILSQNNRFVQADTTGPGSWQETLRSFQPDAVINLAGRSIFSYWTSTCKQQIRDSRILTTRHLVDALKGAGVSVLIHTSAMGYYGHRNDDLLAELEPPGSDFLARVCVDWEAAAMAATAFGTRVVCTRFGVVLGEGGGALKTLLPAFKCGVGGPLGSGNQWFPWIHMDDLVRSVVFLIESEAIHGPVNLVSEHPCRQKTFANVLGRSLRRPAFFPAPGFLMRWVLGEFGASLLASQRGTPDVLIENGFSFNYPDIENALTHLTKR